jgi:hypothetical protein
VSFGFARTSEDRKEERTGLTSILETDTADEQCVRVECANSYLLRQGNRRPTHESGRGAE